jgi:glycosyltransferase involved in cell wall biosynthesis
MRLKVAQAMGLGKPVITTSLGIEGLRDTGAEPPVELAETAGEFVAAVTALSRSRERRLQLGERARAFVARHLSWKAHGDRMDKVLEELCDRRRNERSAVL